MAYRYNTIQRKWKRIYRKFFPVPRSPWTEGYVYDICEVNLVPPQALIRFFSRCIDILEKEKGTEIGDYLEFGVFNGSSLSSMYEAAKRKEVINNMRFFGFDAFEGLPEGSEDEDDGVWKKGFYACSYDDMVWCLRRKGINPRDITFVKGWYNESLTPEMAEEHQLTNPGIVFIDCDTYSSSKAVLDFLAPLLTQPAILCLDDWKLNDLDLKGLGEYKSFNEFLDTNPQLVVKEIPSYNRKSRSFLVKPS